MAKLGLKSVEFQGQHLSQQNQTLRKELKAKSQKPNNWETDLGARKLYQRQLREAIVIEQKTQVLASQKARQRRMGLHSKH